jgi:hypothetical protein
MELVTAAGGRRKALVRQDALSQLRDVGDRLEYVLGRFGRLAGEMADGTVPVPDFGGRVAQINSQLAFVADRMQELFVLEHEAARAEPLPAGAHASARRHAFPRRIVRALA